MATLNNRFLAEADFAEQHEIEIAAPREAVWAAWQGMSISDSPPPVRMLIAIRNMLARVRTGHAQLDMPDMFIPLIDDRPVECVGGLVGRWWSFGMHGNRSEINGPGEFLAFAEPGYGKATFHMRFEEIGHERTHVITETRVKCSDEASRRAMARYWRLISPFSGFVRIMLLRTLRTRATR